MSKECIQVKATDIVDLLYEVYDVPNGICEQIKNMIQRLEAIDNAKPSEALECLEEIAKAPTFMGGNPKYLYHTKSEIPFIEDINTIKQALLKAKEQEKVLKIIKEKKVNIDLLNDCKDRYEYNIHFPYREIYQLTEEEFDLLKEVLCDE